MNFLKAMYNKLPNARVKLAWDILVLHFWVTNLQQVPKLYEQ